MLISGLSFRSISDQRDIVDFYFSLSLDNTSGSCDVGLSGSQNFNFHLQSGKIYDNAQNLVSSYEKNIPVVISGQLGQSSYDYYIDNSLIALDNAIGTGLYSSFYVNPASVLVSFNGNIRGKLPDYSLPSSGHYQYLNYVVTGNVINLDPTRAFRIFSAEISLPSSPYYITGFSTGDITGSAQILITSDTIGLEDYTLPIRLNTNFGLVDFTFGISGDKFISPDVFIGIAPGSVNILNNRAQGYSVQVSNFPSGAQIGISLSYLTGVTGNVYYFKPQTYTGEQLLSGFVTGCNSLSYDVTGLVSGLDPQTAIYETGAGTGLFSSDLYCATGLVSQIYSQEITGLGSGLFTLNYLASGLAPISYIGSVNLTGSYVQGNAYNFAGTGSSPGIATGIVPNGTGLVLVYPTGCFDTTGALVSGADYYEGILGVPKVFYGPISKDYSVLGVGYATGAYISGTVDSNFPLTFEQGEYSFYKHFSGIISGQMLNSDNFDPVTCLGENSFNTTGLIEGDFFLNNTNLDCATVTGLPVIPITGYPSVIKGTTGNVMSPNQVVYIAPSGGFLEDNSVLASGNEFTRTKVSRIGVTPSGDGYYSGIVNQCGGDGVWTEQISVQSGLSPFDSLDNYISNYDYQAYLLGDATLTGSGPYSGDGFFSGVDSGVFGFVIIGSGYKDVAIKCSPNDSVRVLSVDLFKDGLHLGAYAGNYINGYERNYDIGALNIASDTAFILHGLDEGYYQAVVTSREVAPPTVSFTKISFSGCENGGYIKIDLVASGYLRERISVSVGNYVDITARADIDYTRVSCSPYYTGVYSAYGTYFDGLYWEPTEAGVVKSIYIPVYDNATISRNSSFSLSVSAVNGCTITPYDTATVTILDNDLEGWPTGVNSQYTQYISGLISGNETGYISGLSGFSGFSGLLTIGYVLTGGYSPCNGLPPVVPSGNPQPPSVDYWGPDTVVNNSSSKTPPFKGCEGNVTGTKVTGLCPGWGSRIFEGYTFPSGVGGGDSSSAAKFSEISASGEFFDGFLYLGKVCFSSNSTFKHETFVSGDYYPTGDNHPVYMVPWLFSEQDLTSGAANGLNAVVGHSYSYDEFDAIFRRHIPSGAQPYASLQYDNAYINAVNYAPYEFEPPYINMGNHNPGPPGYSANLFIALRSTIGAGENFSWRFNGYTEIQDSAIEGITCPPPPCLKVCADVPPEDFHVCFSWHCFE